jgi:Tfp pilus assembly protein PilF
MILPMLFAAALAAQEPPAAPPPAEVKPAATSPAAAEPAIEAGLKAFRRKRYTAAEIEFRKAMEADPSNAGAAFYLGYTYYKMAEPKRPFHPDKQKSAELFARAFELDPAFKPVWSK